MLRIFNNNNHCAQYKQYHKFKLKKTFSVTISMD